MTACNPDCLYSSFGGCPIVCEQGLVLSGFRQRFITGVEPDSGVEITYVAGPMTGYRDWNKPAFAGMAARLRTAGMVVINPDELHKADAETPWDYYLRRDLAELVKCQRVVLLPGWANSKGATLEHHVAKSLEMEIVYPEHFEEWFKNVR